MSKTSIDLNCPHCGAPLDDERVLSDPWREQVHGARVFGDRPKSGHPLRYVISCGNCLAAHDVRLGPDTHLQTVATSERMLGLAHAIEEQRDPWDLVGEMLSEPFQAELLGTPEIFARIQSTLGGFVRLLRKVRVDVRPEPADLRIPVGPRNVFSLDQLTQGPVLPLAFKLLPVGLRNGLLVVRPDRIRSGDGRQLPLLAVPLDWVRRQPHRPLGPEFSVPDLPSGAEIVLAGVVAPETAQVESDVLPAPQLMASWEEHASDPESSWSVPAKQSTGAAAVFAGMLSESLGTPIERFTDPDTRLALTVHVYATPGDPACVTLISDGMRRYKMPVVGVDTPRQVELCWTLSKGLVQGIGSWPVQLFIRLARMPFSSRSATWPGDVLGPLRPGFGETGLRDALLLASTVLPKALRAPLTSEGRTDVLAVWPVSRAHAILAEQGGVQGVLPALRVAGQSEAFYQGVPSID